MGRRCKMVDHVAKGKFFVVAQQTKSGGSACLPNLVEKEHKIKRKLIKKGDGSHLLDLYEVLEANKSSPTLVVSSSTVMFIQIASES